ncbi:hypothetical protein RRG08_053273 [Elysia crispata]|uniref:Uncharacterized protein n=1 Tax=Elysia crispata TaxID=231223 RepID=A0AAE1E2A1_9GAST|nr:hypothetical protein RRG08_053273 [Elysia crispata]
MVRPSLTRPQHHFRPVKCRGQGNACQPRPRSYRKQKFFISQVFHLTAKWRPTLVPRKMAPQSSPAQNDTRILHWSSPEGCAVRAHVTPASHNSLQAGSSAGTVIQHYLPQGAPLQIPTVFFCTCELKKKN